MSNSINNFIAVNTSQSYSDDDKRVAAVSVALEIISARVSSGAPVHLDMEMDKLSMYADQIQAALKIER